MTTKGVFVPLEALESWLERMECDLDQICSEWGYSSEDGNLESEVQKGLAPEISSIRKYIAEAKGKQ